MNTLRVLFHLARADFYERVRRFSFLLILAAVIAMGVLVNNGTLSISVQSGDRSTPSLAYRSEFNSAWVGTMTVLVMNTFLGLFGFYLVSDCIKRDIRTGVGQIIATTPVSRAAYLIGKWISNFVVLSVLVLILAAAAAAMVLLKQDAALRLGELLMPFLAVALPYMALTAALAVVFETVPWLRGAVGNVVYFFLWLLIVMAALRPWGTLPVKDPIGLGVFRASIIEGAQAAFPTKPMGPLATGGIIGAQYKVFSWPGLRWTLGVAAVQWVWAALGLALILLSATWFARFDPSRSRLRHVRGKAEDAKESKPALPRVRAPHISLPSLSPLISKLAQTSPLLGVLFAELRLLLKGRRWWWWLVLAGLSFGTFIAPAPIAKDYLLPICFLWPLPIWSEMGNRERKHNTYQIVFSSARPVLRQLPATWLAGVLVTVLFSAAGATVLLVHGDLPALAGCAAAVIFVPSLALVLGVLSSGNRVFEVVYVIWWYIGPLQKAAGVDFLHDAPLAYLMAAVGLLLLSAFWRSRQVRI